MLLLESPPKVEQSAQLDAVKTDLLVDIDGMPELSAVTKARLRSTLQGHPLSTLDIATADLLEALREEKLEFPANDRNRVLGTVISAIEGASEVEKCYANAELLKSIPFRLTDDENHKVAGAIAAAFARSEQETAIRKGGGLAIGDGEQP
jgi:hypothetical protein